MGDLLDLLGQTAQAVQSGIAVWGASQEQRREWEYQKALSAARNGVQLLGLTVKSTGDFTQHQGIFLNGGIYENQQGRPVLVSGIGDLRSSIIEKYGTDPFVANAIERAWPAIEQQAQSMIREYSYNQEMIFESARTQDDLSKLWLRMKSGDYEAVVEQGMALIESAQRTHVWNAEQALMHRNNFMSQGVDQLKADLQVISTNGTNVEAQTHAINRAIDGALAAGLFRSAENAEIIKSDMIYGVKFEGLKAELLAAAFNPPTLNVVESTITVGDGPTAGLTFAAPEIGPYDHDREIKNGFAYAMTLVDTPDEYPWLSVDDRGRITTWLRGKRAEAIADLNQTRARVTDNMTTAILTDYDGSIDGIERGLATLNTMFFRKNADDMTWRSYYEWLTREKAGLEATGAASTAAYSEAVRDSRLASIFQEAVHGDATAPELLVELSRMLPSYEDAVWINPDTGEEETIQTPTSGILDVDQARTWYNFITSVKQDPMISGAVGQLQTALDDAGIPDDQRDAYEGVALGRLEEVMREFNYTFNSETRTWEASPEREKLTPELITTLVEDVVGGITDEIRRTDSWKLFNELPEELIEFEEVPDRDRRFLGINWTRVFGRRTTQDQVEETMEKLYSGDLDYFERTYRERATDILNKLEVETSSRFERITNSTVIRHTRSDVNGIPMYWAETPDGEGHWFQLAYTPDGRALEPKVYAGEGPGWIDVVVNLYDAGDGYVHAYNYSGGW